MATRTATVIGVFEDRDSARAAVSELRRAGFREDQIGLVTHDTDRAPPRGDESGIPGEPTHTRWEEGAGIGAAAGAVTGTGLGLAVAAGLIPGVGPVLAGGTLMALLASAGTGAAVGTVLGGLVGLGVPEEEAKYYSGEFTSGRTIVTVRADENTVQAWEVLSRHGAYNAQNRPAAAAPGTGVRATPY
jgi:hypothetical protein